MTYEQATQKATETQADMADTHQILSTELDSEDMDTSTLKAILDYMTVHQEEEFSSQHQTLCRRRLTVALQNC